MDEPTSETPDTPVPEPAEWESTWDDEPTAPDPAGLPADGYTLAQRALGGVLTIASLVLVYLSLDIACGGALNRAFIRRGER